MRRRHPTVIVGPPPKTPSSAGSAERTRAFDAGVVEEVRRALAGRISVTARKTLGLGEVADLPREEAIAAIVVRTRRYAAYQRKWMRRLPGLVMVDADRPPARSPMTSSRWHAHGTSTSSLRRASTLDPESTG
jgi:tRNA A37 N6-isopentenylltransferase MiaA